MPSRNVTDEDPPTRAPAALAPEQRIVPFPASTTGLGGVPPGRRVVPESVVGASAEARSQPVRVSLVASVPSPTSSRFLLRGYDPGGRPVASTNPNPLSTYSVPWTRRYPWSCVGRFFETAGVRDSETGDFSGTRDAYLSGSGTMVGPRHVLTANHVLPRSLRVHSKGGGYFIPGLGFAPGSSKASIAPFGTARVERVYTRAMHGTEAPLVEFPKDFIDMAVLVLDRPIGWTTGWVGVGDPFRDFWAAEAWWSDEGPWAGDSWFKSMQNFAAAEVDLATWVGVPAFQSVSYPDLAGGDPAFQDDVCITRVENWRWQWSNIDPPWFREWTPSVDVSGPSVGLYVPLPGVPDVDWASRYMSTAEGDVGSSGGPLWSWRLTPDPRGVSAAGVGPARAPVVDPHTTPGLPSPDPADERRLWPTVVGVGVRATDPNPLVNPASLLRYAGGEMLYALLQEAYTDYPE